MWIRFRTASKAWLHSLQLRKYRWIGKVIGVREIEEVVVAKVIEFYVPMSFRKPIKPVSQLQVGKLIEFGLQTKKSA